MELYKLIFVDYIAVIIYENNDKNIYKITRSIENFNNFK